MLPPENAKAALLGVGPVVISENMKDGQEPEDNIWRFFGGGRALGGRPSHARNISASTAICRRVTLSRRSAKDHRLARIEGGGPNVQDHRYRYYRSCYSL